MRFVKANLLDNVVSIYDQTKTTILGRVNQKTLAGQDCLGPPLTKFIDVVTDTTLAPQGTHQMTVNGRLFVLTAITAGVGQVLLYNLNLTTGAHSYVGRINYVLPNVAATTQTLRGLSVVDTGTTGWKIFIATTGSVLVNGGVFMLNGIDLADFVQVGFPTIPFATGSNQKAVYMLQGTGNMGAATINTQVNGLWLQEANTRIWFHNGLTTTQQFRHFDYSATPNNPSQTVTITGPATPAVFTAVGHGYSVNDQVTLESTGTLPTGFTAGTVYFVRNQTANTFELSATSGGASINSTSAGSGTHSVRRAFGQTDSLTRVSTGTISALTVTPLQNNSFYYGVPDTGPNAGQACVIFATATALFQGRLSELTSGVTTWSSLETVNILAAVNEITAPSAANFAYSDVVKRYIYLTNASVLVEKLFVNNAIIRRFAGLTTRYLEGNAFDTVNLEFVGTTGIDFREGWISVAGTTIGQRGIFLMDFRSDAEFDYSSIISPVLTIDDAVLKFLTTQEEYFDFTGTMQFFYRTTGFGSASGGWQPISTAEDLSAIASGQQIQFKVLFDIANEDASTPAQLVDLILGIEKKGDMSEHWRFAFKDSVSGSPARTAFAQQTAYSGSKHWEFFAYRRDNGNLVANANTDDNPADFELSTNNGSSYGAVSGAIASNPLNNVLRYKWASPPGVEVDVALREKV